MPLTSKALPLDRLFRALADPTRLQVLHLLLEGEWCVCDLVAALDVPQPTASRHLAYLRRVGLVVARKEGPWAHYRLAEAATPAQARVLDCLRRCFAESPPAARPKGRECRPGKCCD